MSGWGREKQPQNGGFYYQDLRDQRPGQQTSVRGDVCQGECRSGTRARGRLSRLPPSLWLLRPAWSGLGSGESWSCNPPACLSGCLPCTRLQEQVGVGKKSSESSGQFVGSPSQECGNPTVEGGSSEGCTTELSRAHFRCAAIASAQSSGLLLIIVYLEPLRGPCRL